MPKQPTPEQIAQKINELIEQFNLLVAVTTKPVPKEMLDQTNALLKLRA